MTNTKLLDEWIEKSGKKKGYLAEKCGLSRQGFYLKCINEQEFTVSEVNILCAELNITTLRDKENIFFANRV